MVNHGQQSKIYLIAVHDYYNMTTVRHQLQSNYLFSFSATDRKSLIKKQKGFMLIRNMFMLNLRIYYLHA